MTMVPTISAAESRSGVAPDVDQQPARRIVPRRHRDPVVGGAFRRFRRGAANHPDDAGVEQCVERLADRGLVAHAVQFLHLAVPPHDVAVAVEHRESVVQRLENVLAELP